MQRRRFLGISAGVLAIGATAGGWVFLRAAEPLGELTIDGALTKIDRLAEHPLRSNGAWSAGHVFLHCAQSIECSMRGYPEHKSALFQHTIGRAAFSVFASRGRMSHALDEPIPGVSSPEPSTDAAVGLAKLREAFTIFRRFDGQLAPHFAYGELDKREYEVAHVMHFYNHLEQIEGVS